MGNGSLSIWASLFMVSVSPPVHLEVASLYLSEEGRALLWSKPLLILNSLGASYWVGLVKKTTPPNWLIRLPAGVSALTILVFTFLFFEICNSL